MKKIGIAGDSFFAPTQDLQHRSDCAGSGGKHFSEILARTLGYELYTLARGASSNALIRLQIQELIAKNVDFVIYGTTNAARLEYPCENRVREYCAELGVFNFNYSDHADLSSLNVNFGENNMQSDTINTILHGYGNCTESQRKAIELYHKELYDDRFQQVMDAFVISSGVQELIDNRIPYICLFDNFVELIPYFQKPNPRIIIKDHKLLPFRYPAFDEETGKDTVRRYHVSDKNQVELANQLCNYIHDNNLLTWS